jgi:putative ABC transport system permease protein
MGARALLKIAWRSLGRNRRRTAISVGAIGFSLALAVFFIALGDGVYRGLVDDAARMHGGHLTIEDARYEAAPAVDLRIDGVSALRARVAGLPGVRSTKAMMLGQGVIQSGAGAVGAAVVGVEPAVEGATSPLARRIVAGRYLAPEDGARIVIGAKLAERLKVGVGDKLVVSTNDARGQLVEELVHVAGIFRIGSDETDAYLAQIPIGFARRLYGLGPDAATRLAVVLDDPRDRDRLLPALRALAPPGAAVRTWEEVLPDLAAYIRIDRGSNFIFQGILIFLSLFTVFNTITMSVLERTREFAVQLALGARRALVGEQVMVESILLGLLGCALGLTLGGLAGYALQVHGLDMRSFYSGDVTVSGFAIDTVVHAQVTADRLADLGAVVFVATVLVALVPLLQLRRIRIADVLRG